MIGRLRGKIIGKRPPFLMLDVNGVGYELEAPMSTFYELPPEGEQACLYTHLLVREDAQVLYAFINETERSLFRNLLKVNGVGAKMALAILSGMSTTQFTAHVQLGDSQALTRLPGIGRKTAERLIIEMRDRLSGYGPDGEPLTRSEQFASSQPNPIEDAVCGLIALGYKPQVASRMVSHMNAQGLSSEEIIRNALKDSLS